MRSFGQSVSQSVSQSVDRSLGAFSIYQKNSRNSGWDVNVTRLFGSFHWKFSGINGIPEKVVKFSRWKLPNGSIRVPFTDSRLYHQFHTFRGL